MNEHTAVRASTGKPVQTLSQVIIRFAGDSGDGMQLTGDRFTVETAAFGNSLSTLPDFPAEIRAPAGTLPGVSAFQLHFADHTVVTPGDAPTVLVAMNPAALKANLPDLPRGGTVIVDTDEFTKRNLAKVGYAVSPVDDGSLSEYQVHAVKLTSLTVEAVAKVGLSRKDAERSKNMFALGLLSWLYHRPLEGTRRFLETKFGGKREILRANLVALEAGWSYGETTEGFAVHYEVKPAALPPGRYRTIRGNQALAYGLVAAAERSGSAAVPGVVPDHPGVGHPARAVGAEAFRRPHVPGGGRDRRRRSGARRVLRRQPRRDHHVRARASRLKAETIGLAVTLELPLIIVDVQRGGPSTGLPTKTEQADLLQVMFGRNGEAPVPVIAARSASDCFDMALEAARIATTYRTPVFLLSDGYLANGSEPWLIPSVDSLPDLRVRVRHRAEPRADRTGTARPTSGRTCGIRRRWPGRGRSRARPAWSTGSAGSRRRTAPATSPTTRPTTTTWCAPGRPRWPASRCRRWRSTTRPATPRCWCWAGVRRSGRSPVRCGSCGQRGSRSRRRTCVT